MIVLLYVTNCYAVPPVPYRYVILQITKYLVINRCVANVDVWRLLPVLNGWLNLFGHGYNISSLPVQ